MTTRAQSRLTWIFAVAAPVIFLALALLQSRIDALTASQDRRAELFLRSGSLIKKASLGYDALMADIYWTRAVQYYGSRTSKEGDHLELLDPLLNITTTLDPRLLIAYDFGAIFLSEEQPVGAGRPDLAVNLIRKGISANPNVWQLPVDLAFIYYWHLNDYPSASAAYLQGSKVPNAPAWLPVMAAKVAEKGGSVENSISIWSQIYQSTQDPNLRKQAEDHLISLHAQHDEEILDKLSEDYRQRFGRYPASTKELKDAGILPGIPLDPAGFPYVFGGDGKVKLDPASPVVIEKPKKLLGR